MFTVPSYRIRAYLRGVKQNEEARARNRERSPIHLKRTMGEIRLSQSFDEDQLVIPCRVMLNDFSPEGIYVFSEKPLHIGQALSLTLQDPKRLYFIGRVVWCKNLSIHHGILGPTSYE